jgi:hypothetical protein
MKAPKTIVAAAGMRDAVFEMRPILESRNGAA